jgi:hypothetical protein
MRAAEKMGLPEQITALELRDRKRYAVELANVPQRGVTPAPERERALSFSEVTEKSEAERARDPHVPAQTPPATPKKQFTLWEKDAFAFGDFIDILNPLQHIPIVATLYRNLTDDKIGLAPRVIGGALWGRIGGLVGGAVNAFVDWFTGKDVGDHVYAAFFGKSNESVSATLVAGAAATPSQSPLTSPASPTAAQSPIGDATGPQAGSEPRGLSNRAEQSAALLPGIPAASSQALLNVYVPEKRWDTEDGDDRRVRFTA